MRRLSVVLVLAGALSLAACAGQDPTPRAPDGGPIDYASQTPRAPDGDPIEAARELPNAPDVVREGDAADSCGEFVLDQGESLLARAVQCLDAALAAQRQAELAWSWPTIEGDPIVHFAFVGSPYQGVVVFSTDEFDSYGGRSGWTESSCADVATATSGGECPPP